MPSAADKNAFTRIELVVVVMIIALLMGLLLPSIQMARASADKDMCKRNLADLGRAMLNYESFHGALPPSAVQAAGSRRGWATFLLPHIEQDTLAQDFHPNVDWFHPINQSVVTTPVRTFQCPIAPSRLSEGTTDGVNWTGAMSDYSVSMGIDSVAVTGMGVPPDFDRWGPFRTDRRLANITDGLSNTLLLSEQAARPQAWRKGKRVAMDLDPEEGVWASPKTNIDAHGHSMDGVMYPGPCAVNCSNYRGVYSFHSGSANVCFVDGSVRALREGLDIWVYYALLTRHGGEVISATEY